MRHLNHHGVNPQIGKSEKYIICSEIVLGDPRTQQCSGVGICRLFPEVLRHSPKLKSVKGYFIFTVDGRVRLHFNSLDIKDRNYLHHFERGYFEINTEFRWPLWMQKRMPVQIGTSLVPGKYVFKEYNDEIMVFLS